MLQNATENDNDEEDYGDDGGCGGNGGSDYDDDNKKQRPREQQILMNRDLICISLFDELNVLLCYMYIFVHAPYYIYTII